MDDTRIFKQGLAEVVNLFNSRSSIQGAEVTVFHNGLVHILTEFEETTVFISDVEIIWWMKNVEEDGSRKITLLKKKDEQ